MFEALGRDVLQTAGRSCGSTTGRCRRTRGCAPAAAGRACGSPRWSAATPPRAASSATPAPSCWPGCRACWAHTRPSWTRSQQTARSCCRRPPPPPPPVRQLCSPPSAAARPSLLEHAHRYPAHAPGALLDGRPRPDWCRWGALMACMPKCRLQGPRTSRLRPFRSGLAGARPGVGASAAP